VPPAWDEYDQMLSQASAASVAVTTAHEKENVPGNASSLSATSMTGQLNSSLKSAEAPPWNTSPPEEKVSDKVVEETPNESLDPEESVNTAEGNTESASITDLLFADFPDEIEAVGSHAVDDASKAARVEPDTSEEKQLVKPAESIAGKMDNPKPIAISKNADKWYQTIESLAISGLAAELAKNCIFHQEDDEKIELHLDSSSEMLMSNSAINEIEAALAVNSGQQRKLVVAVRELDVETPAQYNQRRLIEIQSNAEQTIENDSFVRQLSDRFAARVVPGSVKPKS